MPYRKSRYARKRPMGKKRPYYNAKKRRYRRKWPIHKAQKLSVIRAGVIPKQMKINGSGFTTVQTPTSLTGNGALVLTAAAGAVTAASYQFTLGDLAQVSTFSSLFDQYMIDEVQLLITPRSNALSFSTATSLNQVNPMIYAVIDRDDNTNLTTIAQATEYDNCTQCNAYSGLNIKLRPSLARAIWAGGAFSGYEIVGPQWIDIANTGVPHYGVKVVVQALQVGSGLTISWDVSLRYKISFRNVR